MTAIGSYVQFYGDLLKVQPIVSVRRLALLSAPACDMEQVLASWKFASLVSMYQKRLLKLWRCKFVIVSKSRLLIPYCDCFLLRMVLHCKIWRHSCVRSQVYLCTCSVPAYC